MQNIFKIKRQTRILHNNQVINPKKITVANIYASNIKVPPYIRHKLTVIKEELGNIIIVGTVTPQLHQ